ncbi:MAG: adenosylmethionine decarboxylase [Candidatus Sericytochromatia bacterium]
MKAFGSQLIAEFLDCEAFELLSQTEAVRALLSEGLAQAEMDLRELACHQFEPMGVTAVAIIGESHVALHTYPETRHLAVDIFTCSPGSAKPQKLLDFLKARLQPQQLRQAEIIRGHKIALQDSSLLTDFSKSAYDIRYHVSATLFQSRSEWQEIRIVENPSFGRMLFLDHELQIAESDGIYHQTLIAPVGSHFATGTTPQEVAILGGGDGGVLQALLQQWPQCPKIWLLERDLAVIAAAQKHLIRICGQAFDAPQLTILPGDAAQQLAQLQQLEAIISDLGTMPWSHTQLDSAAYLQHLFSAIHSALRPGGKLSFSGCPVSDLKQRSLLAQLLPQHFEEIVYQEVFVPSFCEFWVFGQAQRKA